MTENTIEQSLIDQLVGQGYTYYNGTDISPISEFPQRESFASVLLENHFKDSLKKLNPTLPESARVEAYQKVINLGTEDIMENNERFHSLLTNGVTVEYTKEGRTKGINVILLDVENPENNSFWVVNQLAVKENNNEKRFDVVIYVNGLPLVFIELKSATDEKATIRKAYTQIQNYKKAVPSIFYYNAICVISDGIDAKTSSVSAPFTRFLSWKTPKEIANDVRTELQILTEYMLDKKVLVELIRYCTVFEKEEKKDEKTGLISQVKIKKVGAYHQYYAVQKAVEQTLRATHSKDGDRKVGVIWHTQGSGKSLSMVFYSGQIITHPQMENPTIVMLTDRNDLDDQLFGTFGNCVGLLRQTPVQANNREHIKELLKVSGGGVIFTTIQKFAPAEGNVYETLSERTNIVVVADEAHRSQYGFKAREVETDEGMETRYGNAKYLRDAMPNASYIGFTGTPIEKEDKSTPAVFGDYIDVYDIKQAVDDGATVPISYESRLIKIKLDEKTAKKLDDEINDISDATEEQLEKAKKKTATIDAVVGHPDRLKDVAIDIVTHFEDRQKVFEGKAMIVGMTRNICVKLYNEIISLRPDWHNDDLDKGIIKVIMTSTSDDPELFQPHHTTKNQRKDLATRMKDTNDDLKLVIVRDMWLTGFDAPSMHTLYVDKKMKGANLMQAIARVNRVYKDKPGGLVVDYIGIGQDLRKAMATYLQSGGEGSPVVDIKEAIAGMKEKFEIIEQMFNGFDFKAYFKVDTAQKLQVLLGAQNFILTTQKLKERFLKEVTLLSKLFAMSIPSPDADAIKNGVAFFQAVKARINKFTGGGIKSDYEVETAIKQIVDDALSSDGVIDVFDAAGIEAPSVSILSDEFLLEVKNMQQKNIAFELLKKLLSDEVSIRKTKNLVQGKKFSEMLESVVKRYHNNQIDSAQVLAELSDIAKEMRLEDSKSDDLGLTPEEYAFYSVLKQNDSTSFLDDDKMKELIHTIVDVIRKNATVDWSKRDDVRAKLRLTVKKILMRYGYPPDVAKMEADKVLLQSELLAEIFTGKN
ncbi:MULTISPECIES: type I restriction endonuclease subunit R [unclassified Cellulophaga]|uniref:type I restriction endonuclease subunit R n=1 Tax=unclassified Cellulophaga TaxID=2634405 RepID=UPI0026E159C7|nr:MULTISPECIES: type I restriction endonuclease subunit R [unclassified Cellulophaga]MDO6490174.1 type I restriction endonuclease subunit R [Cellulophaga sp. 2_MG-2023]MDO6494632.1 type I restriction endonuclease subunit R [Cellulophaga sp. 3_MG-2023]